VALDEAEVRGERKGGTGLLGICSRCALYMRILSNCLRCRLSKRSGKIR
jgi:hypothetical protein